jgi:hypothetical protein
VYSYVIKADEKGKKLEVGLFMPRQPQTEQVLELLIAAAQTLRSNTIDL